MVRRAPAQLLADLVAQRLAAFRVKRPDVNVDERPRILVPQFAAQAVDIVVAAVDGDQRRRVDCRADDLALLQVCGDEDAGLHSGAGGVGGYAVRQVARRSAGQSVELEVAGDAGGDGDDAVLERPRGVHAVVLDVEPVEAQFAAQVRGAQKRRIAGADVNGVLSVDGKKVGVTPHRRRAGLDAFTGEVARECGVVVHDLQGAEAELADVRGLQFVFTAAFAAFEFLGD